MTSPRSEQPGAGKGQRDLYRVLHFVTADSQFCLPLEHVIKVVPIVLFQYIPEAPAYLRGLITLGGKSVPVIDLAVRMGENNPHHYTIDTPVVLCTDGRKQVGLIVDEVIGVETADEKDLQMRPLFKKEHEPALKAVINTTRGLSLLLDVGNVLDIDLSAADPAKVHERRADGE